MSSEPTPPSFTCALEFCDPPPFPVRRYMLYYNTCVDAPRFGVKRSGKGSLTMRNLHIYVLDTVF